MNYGRLLAFGIVIAALTAAVAPAGAVPGVVHGERPGAAAGQVMDTDGDDLPDEWEIAYGLLPTSADGINGRDGDPDGDHQSNFAEFTANTHPTGRFKRMFAEGSDDQDFFFTRFAFANPDPANDAHLLLTFLGDSGQRLTRQLTIPVQARRTLAATDVPDLPNSFSLVVESDREIGADRTMSWDENGYGGHSETSVAGPSRTWYLAEGATGASFDLFYLLQNPNDAIADVEITYLRPAPEPALVMTYDVAPHSRRTVWVDLEHDSLAGGDVSASIVSDVPIVAERAMYWSTPGQPFRAGHDAVGVTHPALDWFLAEGATGPFFDLYILVANPGSDAATLDVTYMLPDGTTVKKPHEVLPHSRKTIWVDNDDYRLTNTPVSTSIHSTNGVPVVVERAMWWPDGAWHEAHDSAGATETGNRWVLADGEAGGEAGTSTYVLIANTSAFEGQARVTVLFEEGVPVERTFVLKPTSRTNIDIGGSFPQAVGRRFSVLVESIRARLPELVVERSVYASAPDAVWEFGTNALGTNLSTGLRQADDTAFLLGGSGLTIGAAHGSRLPAGSTFTATSSNASIVSVAVNAATGELTLTQGAANTPGMATVTVTLNSPSQPPRTMAFEVRVLVPVTFGPRTPIGYHLFPAVADFNDDGAPDLVGANNDGHGVFTLWNLRAAGLGTIVDWMDLLINRDNHTADYNGDGKLDIVTHTYTPVDDPVGQARLFLNKGDNTFEEQSQFAALHIQGFGHTIVSADFDNDGDLDIFLPYYTHNDPREHFYLLINDGHARFTDQSDAAGIANRGWPAPIKVEGVQVVDFNGDGWLDLYAASRFFISNGLVNGQLTFTDRALEYNLPHSFDEGIKFFDWNNDGKLDLVKHDPGTGPAIFTFDGTTFTRTDTDIVPALAFHKSYGMNVADFNHDGFEDLILAAGATAETRIMVNTGTGFLVNPDTTLNGPENDVVSFADFDGDGRLDIVRRSGILEYARNITPQGAANRLTIEVVGQNGERNQQGRVVRVSPVGHPEIVYTRVVDSGSAYLTQSQYPLFIATPFPGPFTVRVRFDNGEVQFQMAAGERKRVSRSGAVTALLPRP